MKENLRSVVASYFIRLAPLLGLFILTGFFSETFACSGQGPVSGAGLNLAAGDRGHLRTTYLAELPERLTYLKIDQGFSLGLLHDQKISNLHYAGPGGVISFALHHRAPAYISELHAIRAGFQYSRPTHQSSEVYNVSGGVRYVHLRRLGPRGPFQLFAGGQADLTGDMRIIPSMGNSFLFANAIGSLQPRIDVSYEAELFNREWHFDLSLAAALLGYNLGFPQYGTSYRIGQDGGSTLQNTENYLTHPGNHAQVNTGIFYRGAFGSDHNPNWFRVGYVWDYLRLDGGHDLRLYNVRHQFILELYFLLN